MLFVSAGAVIQENIRKSAMQHLFLFDTSVDKQNVRTPVGLLNVCHEARSCTHTMTGNTLDATAIGGVKNNKFYLAHTGRISQFSPVSSNNGWFFRLTNGISDGQTVENYAARFVTVASPSTKAAFDNATGNMLGTQSGYGGVTSFDSMSRTYLLPTSRLSLFGGKSVKLRPKSTMGGRTGTSTDYFDYTQSITPGFISLGSGVSRFWTMPGVSFPVGAGYYENSTPTALGALRTEYGGLYMINPQYNYTRTWFANATWYTSYGSGQNWRNGTPNEVCVELPYIDVTQADDPDAALSFGAIAVATEQSSELMVMDIGSDLTLTTGTSVGTQPAFTCSSAVLAALVTTKSYTL
ncbi:hypothetical protein pEaSNUABM13_00100 [Erwinia phage pEa_SNUABM_13]|nr:hypothetical protein pEaSNUABM13_00100 [Erwinia phage pEa_SNUABM_13]